MNATPPKNTRRPILLTLAAIVVVVIIVVIGAVYWLVARPARHIEERTRRGTGPSAEPTPVTR